MASNLKHMFLLDNNVVFLNHGSFGATPRPVFEEYQRWQSRLEYQPVHYFSELLLPALKNSRRILGNYIGVDEDEVVFVPNATFGINLVVRSLNLQPGDEILSTNHEYGACVNAWEFACKESGAVFVQQRVNVPLYSEDEVVNAIWAGVTDKTKVIYLSHMTSATGLIFPVAEICKKAKLDGIITLVDGAHIPGHLNLGIREIGADFYVGNCHKWLMSPKGAGFLYARREMQSLLEPLIVGWGWGGNPAFASDSPFIDNLELWGTKDHAAVLSVPAAIKFQEDFQWDEVRRRCNVIVCEAISRICAVTKLKPIAEIPERFSCQMASIPVPVERGNLPAFKKMLLQNYRIEIPCIYWDNRSFIRISIQGYNSIDDVNALEKALRELL